MTDGPVADDQEVNSNAAAVPHGGSTVAGPSKLGRQEHRVVLIGIPAFRWLKRLQETAPPPRMDLRYLIEGAVTTLQQAPPVTLSVWIEDSERAMFMHMASQRGQPSPLATPGSGCPDGVAEGAPARNPGQHELSAPARRRTDCRALQIGEPTFLWLKTVQRGTREPRIELRYLLEGVCVLLEREPGLLQRVVGHARLALAQHLAQLERLPISPISSIHLEQTQ